MVPVRDGTATMVGFAYTLRAAGVDASPERVQAMVGALAHLDVLDERDVYWAGRLTLCSGPDDLDHYDRCFAAYFSGERPPPRRSRPPAVTVVRQVAQPPAEDPADQPGQDDTETSSQLSSASRVEVLRHRDIARLGAHERDEVRKLLALLAAGSASRRSRRFVPAGRGRIDAHRTIRAMLPRGGEPVRLYRQAHRWRPRRVVVLVDVSGSMTPYADALLRFAHAAVRTRPRRTEVFSVGTRLTRLTRALTQRDPDTAMAAAARAIPDWSGGTRLGEELKEFCDRWGQRGMARGAVVVVASDGWERGDVALLDEQMTRLHRLAYRVVWANPHKGHAGYEPLTAGMRAALPHVDAFVAGHSLAALEDLAKVISR